MRNYLAVVMVSVLGGAAGGLAASFAAWPAAANPAQLAAYTATQPGSGSSAQEPAVALRDALGEEPETLAAAAKTPDQASAEESMRFFSQGIDAYIADDMVKAQASFEGAVKADPANIEARIALRRINREMRHAHLDLEAAKG